MLIIPGTWVCYPGMWTSFVKIYTQDPGIVTRKHGVISQVVGSISQECELHLLSQLSFFFLSLKHSLTKTSFNKLCIIPTSITGAMFNRWTWDVLIWFALMFDSISFINSWIKKAQTFLAAACPLILRIRVSIGTKVQIFLKLQIIAQYTPQCPIVTVPQGIILSPAVIRQQV